MAAITHTKTYVQITNVTRPAQRELDAQTDAARLERLDWCKHWKTTPEPSRMMCIRIPTTSSGNQVMASVVATKAARMCSWCPSCTCHRFTLRERCQHVAFVRRIEAADQLPDMQTPVAAKGVK